MPYNFDITEWPNSIDDNQDPFNKPREARYYTNINNVSHFVSSSIINTLKGYSIDIETPFNFNIIESILMVIVVEIICGLSCISTLNYQQKVNNKKYATYKILGVKPKNLVIAMIIETIAFALFAIGLGLIGDYFIGIALAKDSIIIPKSYEWLHYLLLVGMTIITITIVTAIKVVKRVKAVAIDSKYLV